MYSHAICACIVYSVLYTMCRVGHIYTIYNVIIKCVCYSLVQSIVFACHTLRWSTAVASLLIAFRIAVALHDFCVCIGHDISALRYRNVVSVQRCHRLFGTAGRPIEHIARVHILIGIVQRLRLHIRWHTKRIDIRVRIVAWLLRFIFDTIWTGLCAIKYQLPLG